MPEKYYITTPIYFVNDELHIGHAYTTVAADVLARYMRLKGKEVFFLTGTDEHGKKIWHVAQKKGVDTAQYVSCMAENFKVVWKKLNITNDDFIRTTEPRHEKIVQQVFSQLLKQGDVYKGEYEGWYCVPCESYWSELEMKEDIDGRKLCPDCGRETEILKEESYFFRLSKYQDRLLSYIGTHPDFIQPESRKNEALQFIKQGLKDLSVTRTAFPWGVGVVEDPQHVVYVWFDALINYISATGYLSDDKRFTRFWPADVHLMGKEIVRFHAVIWPCMLMALGLEIPKKVFGHGWWTVEGKKMSKSKGNVVDPVALSNTYGVDAVRYFLMREVPFGADGDFSPAAFINRFNADLANDIGNLLSRTLTMVEKYFAGKIPSSSFKQHPRSALQIFDPLSEELGEVVGGVGGQVDGFLENLAFSDALAALWQMVNKANNYIEQEAPWKLAKAKEEAKLAAVLYNLCETLKVFAYLISPFMPETAEKIYQQLGLALPLSLDAKLAGVTVAKGAPLFPRIQ